MNGPFLGILNLIGALWPIMVLYSLAQPAKRRILGGGHTCARTRTQAWIGSGETVDPIRCWQRLGCLLYSSIGNNNWAATPKFVKLSTYFTVRIWNECWVKLWPRSDLGSGLDYSRSLISGDLRIRPDQGRIWIRLLRTGNFAAIFEFGF